MLRAGSRIGLNVSILNGVILEEAQRCFSEVIPRDDVAAPERRPKS
ncbi:hypothetical protein ACUXLG_005291 [Ralstonia sp. 121560039-2]|jgi:hypothetical protein